jgi:hypothetical protein
LKSVHTHRHDGFIAPAHLGALFGQGRHPVTDEALGTPWDHRSTDRVAGYSLSLSPPKSVSVLWGLGTPNVAAEVAGAHEAAVAAAVALLEDHAGFSRAGKAGVFQVDTEGLIVASFVHRTSRAVDPTCTPISWCRTRSAVPTVAGGPSTAGRCSPCRSRPATSTRPPSAPS